MVGGLPVVRHRRRRKSPAGSRQMQLGGEVLDGCSVDLGQLHSRKIKQVLEVGCNAGRFPRCR